MTTGQYHKVGIFRGRKVSRIGGKIGFRRENFRGQAGTGADTGFYEGGFFYHSVRTCARENFHRPRPFLLATPTFNHIQFVIVEVIVYLNSTHVHKQNTVPVSYKKIRKNAG